MAAERSRRIAALTLMLGSYEGKDSKSILCYSIIPNKTYKNESKNYM